MKRLIQVFVLLLGVSLYSQDTLSVKDGAYGFDKDFNLDLHITTATGIKALQFDIKYDGTNFNYKSQYALVKERLGGEDSDHVITVKEVVSGTVRVLIYSPSNKLIPYILKSVEKFKNAPLTNTFAALVPSELESYLIIKFSLFLL